MRPFLKKAPIKALRQASGYSGSLSNLRVQWARPDIGRNSLSANASTQADVLARYQDKLKQKAAAEGVESVDELKEKLAPEIEATLKKLNESDPLAKVLEQAWSDKKTILEEGGEEAKTLTEKLGEVPPVPKNELKNLDSFVKLDKFKELGKQEIEFLWRARHINNERALCAIVGPELFYKMFLNGRKHPMFVLPLPKGDEGCEMHIVQWNFVGEHLTHVIFTTLAEFKLHQDFARPHTTLMFHTDLAVEKDCVLLNGQVEKDSAMSLQDAQFLILALQEFYGATITDPETTKRRQALLRSFTEGSDNFPIDMVIEEIETFTK